MPESDNREVARFDFRLADAFPPKDRIARYVMRLSMALGDLRIVAGEYAIREDQPEYERQYFVRLSAAHLHEVALLFNPPDTTIPTVEEFIRAAIPAADKATRKRIREQHKEVKRQLSERLISRPESRLGAELKRMRNTFFHYHVDELNEVALTEAMHLAGEMRTAYVVRDRTLRADYADLVGMVLMHPWDAATTENWTEMVSEFHDRVVKLMAAFSDFVHHVEALYLHNSPKVEITLRERD